jgi:threonine aldolase
MARRLETAIRKIPSVKIVHPVQTNAVFATIPDKMVNGMYERGWKFYTHVGSQGEARLMCSWDTTAQDVDEFAADLTEEASTIRGAA